MKNDLSKILVSEQQIDEMTSSLAKKIEEDYKDSKKELVALCILKGSLVFTADLIRKINIPVSLEFMKVSSYGAGTVSSGKINVQLDMSRTDYENIDILVIEDIIDSGYTLSLLLELLKEYPNRRIIVTPIGGQACLFGRGNQQISPAVIKEVGRENIIVVATKSKIDSFYGKQMLVDSGDDEVNEMLKGFMRVVVSYGQESVVKVG